MSTVEHEVYGNVYQFGKMDAIRQFHVMRRLGTVSSGLGEGISRLSAAGGAAELLRDGSRAMLVVGPLLEAIGRMTNEDSEYVINTCLAVVKRRQGATSFSPVQVNPGQLMFPDISMTCMIALVFRTLEHNVGGFFSELLSALPAPAVEEQTSSSQTSRTT